MGQIKKIITSIVLITITTGLIGCGSVSKDSKQENYEGRTFYEIFVRSFNDSDGDGTGDLKGVSEKLDYLEELGVKGIWLMPINEATSYHGYDVEDYYSIEKDYGSMEDLENLIEEAHKRDIKVVMDLVINHTSTENEWFKSAKQGENSEYRDYYLWSSNMNDKGKTSAMQTKPWVQNGDKNELYYAIFWSGMPDLNFDNPKVVDETKKIAKFYLDKGIDGFRLDAAKWIFNEKDKNIAFWTDFNKYVKSVNSDAILLGEVWDNAPSIYEYTNCLDSFFEFSIGNHVKDRIMGESISSFVNDYKSVEEIYKEENKDFIISTFLTNHDQVRMMTLLKDDFKMKMAATMNLTLPGTPFIYYGEETGTIGQKPDEKLREPFAWDSKDKTKNASWEDISSDLNKVSVDVQEKDEDSILNFYKQLIKVKNNYKSLRYGEVDSIDTDNRNVLAMIRTYEKETSYVLINGSEDEAKVEIPKGSYEVLFSTKNGYNKNLKSNGNITLDKQTIMIITKK